MRPTTVVLGVSLVCAGAAHALEPFTRAGLGIAFLAASHVRALTEHLHPLRADAATVR